MITAYFDFDGTLIAGDSDLLFHRHVERMGRLTPGARAAMHAMLERYHAGTLDAGHFAQFLRARVAQWSPEAFAEAAATCFHAAVKPLFFPAALDWIAHHRARRHRIVLISGGPHPLIAAAGRYLACDAAFGCDVETAEGVFTGRVREPMPFGRGKLAVAEADAAGADSALGECFFYSDSFLDLPLLRAVGTPIVVNPDGRLAAEACARGWRSYRLDGAAAVTSWEP